MNLHPSALLTKAYPSKLRRKLVANGEPERRAKFDTKDGNVPKTKKLLGIRGYYTNIGEDVLSNRQVEL